MTKPTEGSIPQLPAELDGDLYEMRIARSSDGGVRWEDYCHLDDWPQMTAYRLLQREQELQALRARVAELERQLAETATPPPVGGAAAAAALTMPSATALRAGPRVPCPFPDCTREIVATRVEDHLRRTHKCSDTEIAALLATPHDPTEEAAPAVPFAQNGHHIEVPTLS
jgi:hypothetical protein